MASLIEKRLEYVRAMKEMIPYVPQVRRGLSHQELVSRYYIYLSEMGLKFDDYQVLLPEYLRNKNLLDSFVMGAINLNKEKHRVLVLKYAKDFYKSQWIEDRIIHVLNSSIDTHNDFVLKTLYELDKFVGQNPILQLKWQNFLSKLNFTFLKLKAKVVKSESFNKNMFISINKFTDNCRNAIKYFVHSQDN